MHTLRVCLCERVDMCGSDCLQLWGNGRLSCFREAFRWQQAGCGRFTGSVIQDSVSSFDIGSLAIVVVGCVICARHGWLRRRAAYVAMFACMRCVPVQAHGMMIYLYTRYSPFCLLLAAL